MRRRFDIYDFLRGVGGSTQKFWRGGHRTIALEQGRRRNEHLFLQQDNNSRPLAHLIRHYIFSANGNLT